jgi:hypothetical protein
MAHFQLESLSKQSRAAWGLTKQRPGHTKVTRQFGWALLTFFSAFATESTVMMEMEILARRCQLTTVIGCPLVTELFLVL